MFCAGGLVDGEWGPQHHVVSPLTLPCRMQHNATNAILLFLGEVSREFSFVYADGCCCTQQASHLRQLTVVALSRMSSNSLKGGLGLRNVLKSTRGLIDNSMFQVLFSWAGARAYVLIQP